MFLCTHVTLVKKTRSSEVNAIILFSQVSLSPLSKTTVRALPLSYFLETLSLSRLLSTLIFILIRDERNLYGMGFVSLTEKASAPEILYGKT